MLVSVGCVGAVRGGGVGDFGLVGRGIPQFRFLHVILSGSCICHMQCGQVHTGVAFKILRCVGGVRGGSCPMGT